MENQTASMVVENDKMTAEIDGKKMHIGLGDEEFTPIQLLFSSIIGCSMGTLKTVLEKRRITYDDLSLTATLKRSDHLPNVVEAIGIDFFIEKSSVNQEEVDIALEQSIHSCPVVQSVKKAITINEAIHLT